jgi:aminoglycoside phosphotransferase family enzyme/predicted kinase
LNENDRLHRLILALETDAEFGHPVERFEILQTHISCVLLTGPFAYKFKKPVDFGFLDFSTLVRRGFFCEEELRLNRRLAPGLYLEVLPITGSEDSPQFGGTGPAIEYCLKMRQFPQEAQLDRVLARGTLTKDHIDDLALQVANFHASIAVAGPEMPFGAPAQIRQYTLENFEQIGMGPEELNARDQLDALRTWTVAKLNKLEDSFTERQQHGYVRECHGDMHLTNMALLDASIVIYDCIEFNEALRWNDVVSEIAFLLMDLDHRQRPDLARRFLNRYLERSGDYAGLRLLDFYRAYRSLVRAKVAYLQCRQLQSASPERANTVQRFLEHVVLAERYTKPITIPPLIITHGLPGSGKSWLTEQLVDAMGAIRIRSDVERKRLEGLRPEARTQSGVGADLYRQAMTERTYQRLRDLARDILASGFPVIVDATFLKHDQRAAFQKLAQAVNAPFRILDCRASVAALRERIRSREAARVDASEAGLAVLEYQLAASEGLTSDESAWTITVDTEQVPDLAELAAKLRR